MASEGVSSTGLMGCEGDMEVAGGLPAGAGARAQLGY